MTKLVVRKPFSLLHSSCLTHPQISTYFNNPWLDCGQSLDVFAIKYYTNESP
jgi:hypothetical protein